MDATNRLHDHLHDLELALQVGDHPAALRHARDLRACADAICLDLTPLVFTCGQDDQKLPPEERAQNEPVEKPGHADHSFSKGHDGPLIDASRYLALETWQHSAGAPATRAAAERDCTEATI